MREKCPHRFRGGAFFRLTVFFLSGTADVEELAAKFDGR